VRLDREVGERISEVKEEIYKRTSINNTRLRQKKMRIEVDTSDYVTGGVLSIKCEDGK